MEASAPQNIRFLSHETNEQIRWFDPGSGSQGSRSCGIMRSWGHVTGGMVHAEAGFVRCQRPGCPECFDKPRGYLDRCRDRILAGIGKSLDEGWEEDLQELVVAPYFAPGSEQMLLDATYRRGLIRSVRLEHSARVGIRCGCGHAGEVHDPSGTCQAKGCAKFGHPCRGEGLLTPGAYVIHPIAPLGRIASDSCPDRPHLHLFFRGWCEGSRKPGLYTVLRDATRGYRPGMRNEETGVEGPPRLIPAIGWFGRRSTRKDPVVLPAPEKTRFCHSCMKTVPKAEWSIVASRRFLVDAEGAWSAPVDDVTFLRNSYERRSSLDEESRWHRGDLQSVGGGGPD